MEITQTSRKANAGELPEFLVSLTKPETKSIGWGGEWKPSIGITTGSMPDGNVYKMTVTFDNDAEIRSFLRTQTARFFNPKGLWLGDVVEKKY